MEKLDHGIAQCCVRNPLKMLAVFAELWKRKMSCVSGIRAQALVLPLKLLSLLATAVCMHFISFKLLDGVSVVAWPQLISGFAQK